MAWERLAEAQCGVVSRRQLREAGLSDSAITRLVRSGWLRVIAPAVYIVRGAPLDHGARLWRAVLSTGGALGFGTALQLWGVIEDCAERIVVVLPRQDHNRPVSGVRIRRRDHEAAAFTTLSGLPITTRSVSLLDHLGSLRFGAALPLADRALQRNWLSAEQLSDRLRRRPHLAGNNILRRIEAQLCDGAAAESERRLHRLLRHARITGWRANDEIWLAGRLLAVGDGVFRDAKLVVEIDGLAHHTAPDRFQRDRTRQNALIGAGWTVLRFTWADLVERPGYVIAVIRRQLSLAA